MTLLDELKKKKCQSCEGKNIPPMGADSAKTYLQDLPAWTLSDDAKSIRKLFLMKNFMAAVKFINEIAKVAEGEDHHPDIHLTGYRKLTIELSTHSIGGLSENDFILAAKIESLPKDLKP